MKFKITNEYIHAFVKQNEVEGCEMNGCLAIKGSLWSRLFFIPPKPLIVLTDDKSTTVIELDSQTKEPVKTVKYWFSEIKDLTITKRLTSTLIKIQFKYDEKITFRILRDIEGINYRKNSVIQQFKNLKNKFLNDKLQSKYYR